MSQTTRYTVIGAGNGGKTMAAHLAIMGFPVTLYNRTYEKIVPIKARGGIELFSRNGGPRGFGKLALVTGDLAEALEGAEIIMVVVPATGHREVAAACVPYFQDGQIVVLNPGRTGGCLEFVKVLRDMECSADVTLAEAETLLYACRSEGPVQARILRIKDAVPLAALPATRTRRVLDALESAFPQFIDGGTVLNTGLDNMGAIFHPTLALLNAARIESTHGGFQFYVEGVTPSVSLVLESLDRERVTVASALGLRPRTAQEWLELAYNAVGDSLYEAIQNQTGYRGIAAPMSLNHRYILEDVPMSLVPIAALGERYGVRVDAMNSIIRLACIVHQTDFWRRGRSLETMGIEGLSVGELDQFVREGNEALPDQVAAESPGRE